MAVDPRKFLTDSCARGNGSGPATRAKDFFSALGKVGDLEVLNEVDNDIGKGLRTLAQISENVRNESGPVPSIIRQTGTAVLDAGADFVLDTVGTDSRKTRTQGIQFSPQVANRALGQGRAIYEAVREGRLDQFEDIPQAIADFSNLEILLRSIFTPNRKRTDKFKQLCISPYAIDLIARAPKHKFMFVVQFVLNDPYSSLFNDTNGPSQDQLAFVIKRSSRPNISFDYEEVNYYNFRTKILKRHEYQPMSMSFYDDQMGSGLHFMKTYLEQISPLSRNGEAANIKLFEANGMSFDAPNGLTAGTSSLLPNTNTGGFSTTIIKYINLYHLHQGGKFYDLYQFASPKITEWQLDELDMTQSGDGTELSFNFAYDAVHIDSHQSLEEAADTITELTGQGFYPIVPNFNGETTRSPAVSSNA